MPTLDEFRNNSGVFAEEPAPEQDAAAPEEEIEELEPVDDLEDAPIEELEDLPDHDEPEPDLTPKEKTAFEKRMERERKKIEEQLSKQFEDKYSKHKRVIDQLGGDPDKIEQAMKERQLQDEALRMAEYNGWDEQQMQWYIQQQQANLQQENLQKELAELRISNQVNDLRDNPEFAGISSMKKDIADIVAKSNGTLNVEQAYWALGGQKRAQQTKREAEQRAAVQRRTRVVASDAPGSASTEKAIPSNILAQAAQMGMSEKELRELMNFDSTNINDYRSKKKAK
jgi:hypothetical protein